LFQCITWHPIWIGNRDWSVSVQLHDEERTKTETLPQNTIFKHNHLEKNRLFTAQNTIFKEFGLPWNNLWSPSESRTSTGRELLPEVWGLPL
jgi:hypothetical protein